jgi:hypothetical protein
VLIIAAFAIVYARTYGGAYKGVDTYSVQYKVPHLLLPSAAQFRIQSILLSVY